ncbi:MAG TPA: tyrosine-type recombinase/integrase [Terriglobia bacterium]|nr:tyrosine-type recombinase/integrase [Terriglobia bacterium]
MARSRIKDDHLFLYTSKAGTPVYCPLPEFVVSALNMIPIDGPYFFWTGNSKIKAVCFHCDSELRKSFKQAKVENGHAHRFRDTFAVSLLIAGKPIAHVAVLLGHRSIMITERHYSPWVRARQEQLEAEVRDSWKRDPVVLLQTKGTPEVHGEARLSN